MKRCWFVSGIILLVFVIVIGFTLIKSTPPSLTARTQGLVENPKDEKVLEIVAGRNINGDITSGAVQVQFEDPGSLPEESEAAFGVFLEREENIISLGTGSIEVEVRVEVVNDEVRSGKFTSTIVGSQL